MGFYVWFVKIWEFSHFKLSYGIYGNLGKRKENLLFPTNFCPNFSAQITTMGSSQAAVSFLTNIARAAFGLGVGATVLNSSLYTVDGGRRAVLFDRFRGVIDETIGEGTHFLVPWLQKPFIFDIRTRPHTFSSVSGTKDAERSLLARRKELAFGS